MAGDPPFLVVGLGNPGPDYAGNRHNVGAMVLDVLVDRVGGRLRSHRARASRSDVLEGRLDGVRVVLARPRSYMNLSGGPVAAVRSYFSVPLARTLVIHDELDLPFGVTRLKQGGGDNGHNGLRSITAALGGPAYCRLRFGIDRPPGRQDPADFVLRDFSAAQRRDLPFLLDRAADAAQTLVTVDLATAQNRFND